METKKIVLNSNNTLSLLENHNHDKTIVIHGVTMKLENSADNYANSSIKYADGTQIALSGSVNNNEISNLFDAGSSIHVKKGQNVYFKANDGLSFPLSGTLTILVNYDLI